jgi:ATP-dependent helicase/nuclease subunit A
MFQFTAAQAQAVDGIHVNQAVMAGAGAGKTRVLVERYLNLLKASARPLNSVVAVTFTEKAAAEMRTRVRDRLTRERRDPTLDAGTRARCDELLRQIDSARINTIHALCAEILRASAAELGLDPAFAILEEAEAAILLEGAIEDALRAGVASGALERLVALGFTLDAIRSVLRTHGRVDPPVALAGIGLPPTPDQRVAVWLREWTREAKPHIDAILTSADFQFCRDYAPPPGPLPDKIATAFQTITPTLTALMTTDDPAAQYTLFARCIDLPKPGNVGGKALIDAREVIKLLRGWAERLKETIGPPPGALDRQAAEAEPDWLDLIRACAAAYGAAKTARAALDFEDLERLAHDLLTTQPAARARWRAEIAALLVDEFQDTSPIQWAIVRALADPAEPGRLFLVGDAKQSIYAFRGADVSVFAGARAEIEAAGGQRIAFRDSFRAHRPLVTAYNALFERILQPEGDPPEPFETRFDRDTDAMIAHVQDAPADDPPLEVLFVPAKGDEAAAVARRIRELVGSAPVRAGGTIRPAASGDIAVLLPALTETVTQRFEGALRAAGIPFVTIAGRGYFARQEVADVMRLLRALEAPGDDLALAAALRSPLFHLSDDALLALRLLTGPDDQPLPLWDALARAAEAALIPEDERAAVGFAVETLARLRALAGRVPIAELIEIALDETGYPTALESLPRDGSRRRANLDKLIDLARASGHVRLNAFNRYAEALTAAETREGEAALDAGDAVRIMTIHKSKGLEFPIVFVANAHRPLREEKPPVLLDPTLGFACTAYDDEGKMQETFRYRRIAAARKRRETAERRRLLYVAMTRAADRCIVSGEVSKIGADKQEPNARGMFGWLLDALADRGAPLPELEPGAAQDRAFDGWSVRLQRADEAGIEAEAAAAPVDLDALPDLGSLASTESIPGLLAPLSLPVTGPARALPVTLAVDLGALAHVDPDLGRQHLEQARRRLLHAAPLRIPRATPEPLPVDPTPRLVGELVHRALRWHDPAATADQRRERLEQTAWELGIVDAEQRARAIDQAAALLTRELAGDVQRWIETARRVLRETPFVHRRGGYDFHGVIDVLIERPDGTWALIDYKTSGVPAPGSIDPLRTHARRYHLQVGLYAEAARELLGLDALDVYLRYIRYSRTIAIDPAAWMSELRALEARIETVMRTTP